MDAHIEEEDVDENMSNSSIVQRQHNFQTTATVREEQQNIVFKLLNRQNTGYFSNTQQKRSHENAFKEIPRQLSFCLKDIVPYCYLEGYVYRITKHSIYSIFYISQAHLHGAHRLWTVLD